MQATGAMRKNCKQERVRERLLRVETADSPGRSAMAYNRIIPSAELRPENERIGRQFIHVAG